MTPVHVIVGEDPRAQAMWAEAFAGVVDLYSFGRNIETFERLTAASAPVDLVVLTPAQSGPFNLTPDQFVARVLESRLGSSRHLSNLHVIVVGQRLDRPTERAIEVPTLDAAIRLVKYGEAPQPRAAAPVVAAAPRSALPAGRGTGSQFSESLISRIWDAADAAEAADRRETAEQAKVMGGGAPATAPVAAAAPATAPASVQAPAELKLFAQAVPTSGFVIAPVQGGGATAPQTLGAPGQSIDVASGMLQASRPYALPNGAGYRGPELRAGAVPAASHHSMSIAAPVPPALGAQVQQAVYGSPISVADPVLVWSSSARSQIVAAGVPVPTAAPMQAPMPAAAPAVMQQLRTVPIEPPVGIYGGAVSAGAMPAAAMPMPVAPVAPAQSGPIDPMLQRAERENAAAVSFG